eukprot:gene25574-biopygen13530
MISCISCCSKGAHAIPIYCSTTTCATQGGDFPQRLRHRAPRPWRRGCGAAETGEGGGLQGCPHKNLGVFPFQYTGKHIVALHPRVAIRAACRAVNFVTPPGRSERIFLPARRSNCRYRRNSKYNFFCVTLGAIHRSLSERRAVYVSVEFMGNVHLGGGRSDRGVDVVAATRHVVGQAGDTFHFDGCSTTLFDGPSCVATWSVASGVRLLKNQRGEAVSWGVCCNNVASGVVAQRAVPCPAPTASPTGRARAVTHVAMVERGRVCLAKLRPRQVFVTPRMHHNAILQSGGQHGHPTGKTHLSGVRTV